MLQSWDQTLSAGFWALSLNHHHGTRWTCQTQAFLKAFAPPTPWIVAWLPSYHSSLCPVSLPQRLLPWPLPTHHPPFRDPIKLPSWRKPPFNISCFWLDYCQVPQSESGLPESHNLFLSCWSLWPTVWCWAWHTKALLKYLLNSQMTTAGQINPGVLKRTVLGRLIFKKCLVMTGVHLQTLLAQFPYQCFFAISSKKTDLYIGQMGKSFHAKRKAQWLNVCSVLYNLSNKDTVLNKNNFHPSQIGAINTQLLQDQNVSCFWFKDCSSTDSSKLYISHRIKIRGKKNLLQKTLSGLGPTSDGEY